VITYTRILVFFVFVALFTIVYALGTQSAVTEAEAEEILAYFEGIIAEVDAMLIFTHNLTIALAMFIPGAGMVWGFFSAWTTGFAFAALEFSNPKLSEISPLAVFLTPFGMMELTAYAIAMSRSFLLLQQIIKKTSIFTNKKTTLIEIGIVIGLLLIGGIVENEMIQTAMEDEITSFSSTNQCELDPDPGMCKAYFPKYYFDKNTQTCQEFIYGGCGGVVPFDTMEQCKLQCSKNP